MLPALTVGAVSGVAGLVSGGFGGIVSSRNPVLFATAAAIQCFGLGSTFWYIREAGTRVAVHYNKPVQESLLPSTFAGAVAGAVNGTFRSRSNVLPGALIFGILGLLGQGAYNSFQPGGQEIDTKLPFGQRLLDSRWVPLKRLSDADYVGMLNEKSLKIDAEIAIIDEKIATLQQTRTENP